MAPLAGIAWGQGRGEAALRPDLPGFAAGRVFRPQQSWPKLPVGLFTLAALATIAINASSEVTASRPLFQRPNELAMFGSMIWGAIECWSYFAKMRKRLALGLADRLVTSQFALWGTRFSLSAAASGLYLFVPLITGVWLLDSPLLAVSVQGLMLAVTFGAWMAFSPPKAYRRYLLGTDS